MARGVEGQARGWRWGFARACGVIVFLVVCGHAIGTLMARWPPWRALLHAMGLDYSGQGLASDGWLAAMGVRDWVFCAFLVSASGFVIAQRAAVGRFFRSMHVGVSLVVLTTLAIVSGVLVPQIEGFEDPAERVTAENYERQYARFAWAEGYFLYHCLHLYGIGMPEQEIPAEALAGLERYGRRYGHEEQANKQKLMTAAFSGGKKSQEIEAFIERHDTALRRAFDVATFLDLNRVYKSHWFASLLTLLFVAVACNTFRYPPRVLFTMEKLGFFVTHLGILTLLVGGLISNLATDRGLLRLFLDDPTPRDTYFRHYDMNKLGRMPFALRLERFARKDWKQIQVEFEGERFSAAPPGYTLWEGRKIRLDYAPDEQGEHGELRARLELRVLDIAERVQVDTPTLHENFDPARPTEVFPVAEFEASDMAAADHDHAPGEKLDHSHTRRIQLSPFARQRVYFDPDLAYRLQVAFGGELDDDPSLAFPPDDGRLGTIEFNVRGSNDAENQVEPLRLDAVYQLAGGWTARVLRATANFQLDPRNNREIRDPRPLAEQPPIKPAVWLELTPPAGSSHGPPAERFLLDGIDWREHGLHDDLPHSEVWARMEWDPWLAPGPPRYTLHWSVDSRPALLDAKGARQAVIVGEPLPLPGREPLVPLAFVLEADFEKNVHFLVPRSTGGFDEDFYATDPCGVDLEVIEHPGTPEERREVVRLVSTRMYDGWRSPDGRYSIWFYENQNMLPFEWRSVLSVIERDGAGQPYVVPLGPEEEREIRVNDYFKYRGYRFFQTDADVRLPTYSGIGVVYDPGIPVVLSGMYTIIAGTALAFLVRPIVKSRRKRGLPA